VRGDLYVRGEYSADAGHAVEPLGYRVSNLLIAAGIAQPELQEGLNDPRPCA
jgi:hypothetical protein